MKIGEVTGSVVATRKVDSLHGVRLLLVQPLDDAGAPKGDPVVACDTCQAGPGDRVLYEGGREAAMALRETFNPSDATVMAIIDDIVEAPA
jgi:ethanolamine utilization protein EutN